MNCLYCFERNNFISYHLKDNQSESILSIEAKWYNISESTRMKNETRQITTATAVPLSMVVVLMFLMQMFMASIHEIPSIHFSSKSPINQTQNFVTRSLDDRSCDDGHDLFKILLPSGKLDEKDCDWVRENPARRCIQESVQKNCPAACNICKCEDNEEEFQLSYQVNSESCDCRLVQENLSLCESIAVVRINCPLSCGVCSPRNAKSLSSAIPTITATSLIPTSTPFSEHSMNPSNLPSKKVFLLPSFFPTITPSTVFNHKIDGSVKVLIGFESLFIRSSDHVKNVIEEVTGTFLSSNMMKTRVNNDDILYVTISQIENDVEGVKDGVLLNKGSIQGQSSAKGCIIEFFIKGSINARNGIPTGYSFSNLILLGFNSNFPEYKRRLIQSDETESMILIQGEESALLHSTFTFNLFFVIICILVGALLMAYLAVIQRRKGSVKTEDNFSHSFDIDIVKSPRYSLDKTDSCSTEGYCSSDSLRNVLHEQENKEPILNILGQRNFHRSLLGKLSKESLNCIQEPKNDRFDDIDQKASQVPSAIEAFQVNEVNMVQFQNCSEEKIVKTDQSSLNPKYTEKSLNIRDTLFDLKVLEKQQSSFLSESKKVITMNEKMDDNSLSSKNDHPIVFDHVCSSGTLGLTIESTTRGPSILDVKNNSESLGILFPSDVIVEVDNHDTSSMTALQLKEFLRQTYIPDIKRKMLILRNNA